MSTLNLGIVAHVDAGKTTLTERLLFAAGVIDEIGRVDDGSTQTDTLTLERQRGITIKSAVVSFVIDDVTVNLIDTPGHPDFIAEVERVLNVLDGAVLVVSAVEGVQSQTRLLMRTLQRLNIPTLIFVNKIDRVGAQYERSLRSIAERLTPAIILMGSARGLGTRSPGFASYSTADFTSRLVDLLADQDEAFLAAYVDDEATVSHRRLRGELAVQTGKGLVHPVFFGSALTGAGVEELISGITELLPAAERPGRGCTTTRSTAKSTCCTSCGGSSSREVSVKDYEPIMSFGEDVARTYDDEQRGDEYAAVAFLEKLAGGGSALELAVGTGRIALPLADRGIRVDGVDISPAMVARLRTKPGGDRISVTIGDFADVPVPDTYRLIYVVFNTLFNLLTQEDQVRCFENVAAHLTDDGSFVIEAGSPAFLYRLRNDQHVDAESIEVDTVRLDVLRHDPAKQMLDESHVSISRTGVQLNPIVQRYAWPAELDLMARIAGLRLKERWDGWNREPFTGKHNVVSVYGR